MYIQNIHIYKCTYLQIYIFTNVHIYRYTYIQIYVFLQIYVYTYLYIYIYQYIYIYTNIHIYKCTYIQIYIFTDLQIYIYIYIHTHVVLSKSCIAMANSFHGNVFQNCQRLFLTEASSSSTVDPPRTSSPPSTR